MVSPPSTARENVYWWRATVPVKSNRQSCPNHQGMRTSSYSTPRCSKKVRRFCSSDGSTPQSGLSTEIASRRRNGITVESSTRGRRRRVRATATTAAIAQRTEAAANAAYTNIITVTSINRLCSQFWATRGAL